MQVVALYFFSNYDAESSNCPEKRKQFILNAMADSETLNDYGIDDFNKFRHKLDKIEPSVFLELTNILYQSQIIRHLVIKPDNRSGILDRNLNLHKPDF
jgi:hypothetical protein